MNDPITRAKAFRARCKSPDNLDTTRERLDQALKIIDELVALPEAPRLFSEKCRWNLRGYQPVDTLTVELTHVTDEPEAEDIARRVGLADIKHLVREVPQFQVGDRVRYTGGFYFTCEPDPNKVGTVIEFEHGWVQVRFDIASQFDIYVLRPWELQKLDAEGFPWVESKL